MFPRYVMYLENNDLKYLQPKHYQYYRGCIVAANEYLQTSEAADLRNWTKRHVKIKHKTRNGDYDGVS